MIAEGSRTGLIDVIRRPHALLPARRLRTFAGMVTTWRGDTTACLPCDSVSFLITRLILPQSNTSAFLFFALNTAACLFLWYFSSSGYSGFQTVSQTLHSEKDGFDEMLSVVWTVGVGLALAGFGVSSVSSVSSSASGALGAFSFSSGNALVGFVDLAGDDGGSVGLIFSRRRRFVVACGASRHGDDGTATATTVSSLAIVGVGVVVVGTGL